MNVAYYLLIDFFFFILLPINITITSVFWVNGKCSNLSSSKTVFTFHYKCTKRSIWHPDIQYQTHTACAMTSIWIRRTHKQRQNCHVWVEAICYIEDFFFFWHLFDVDQLALKDQISWRRHSCELQRKKGKKRWLKATRLPDTTNIHTNIQHQSMSVDSSGRLVYSS